MSEKLASYFSFSPLLLLGFVLLHLGSKVDGKIISRTPVATKIVNFDYYDGTGDYESQEVPLAVILDDARREEGETKTPMLAKTRRLSDVSPDVNLSTPELLRKYGFPAESHEVVTQDGYVLTLHRIPHGRNDENVTKSRPVVLLHHGLLCSSSDWLMNTVDKALAYQLADKGYDVWMANARGNTYSRKHMTLSPKQTEFWDFSFHEVGVYDLPAYFDYIFAKTKRKSLHYIGHSMGTVVFWICMSTFPQYNEKIDSMFALGPVAFLNGTVSPIRYFSEISTELAVAEFIFGEKEFLPNDGVLKAWENYACAEKLLEKIFCEQIMFLLCGYDRSQLNETMVPVIMGHNPAGTSSHTIIHFLQLMKSAKFRQFDYGSRLNFKKYGKEQPPDYDLKKVTAKVALFYGENDWLAVPGDVLELAGKLPNVKLAYKVKLDSFNHLDFLYAKDSNELLYNQLFRLLKEL